MAHDLMSLGARARRMVVLGAVLRIVAASVVVLAAYSITPNRVLGSAQVAFKLVIDLVVVGALLAWLTARVMRARFPVVAASEALGIISVVFVCVYATVYLMMDGVAHTTFSEPLDHVKALYMTVTILSTVGFGDIIPRTNPARIVVAVQMVLDLILIGAVARVLFGAARHGISRREEAESA